SPAIALPISAFGRWRVGHAFPPHTAVWSERDVGEDAVARKGSHRVWIGLFGSAGSHSEETSLGIDGAEITVLIGTNPRDVVAHSPNFPAFESFGRYKHREVGFAASTRKSRGDISFFSLGIFNAEDEHVLGHPAFVARDVGSDTQREALFAKQRVATVARTV